MFNNLLKIAIILVTFIDINKAETYYCDNELCQGPDKYCCGQNVCCNTTWQIWYLWFVVAIVLLATAILAWKYQSIDCSEQDELSSSTQTAGIKHSQYDYKLLVNDIESRFFDNPVDISNDFTLKIINQ